jgi:tetratricopeptide (TPR) repeat protein
LTGAARPPEIGGMMRLFSIVATLGLIAFAGCAKKPVSDLDRKKAAAAASEAQFAVSIREYDRAEKLLAEATQLCPDDPQYWLGLGSTRVRAGQRDAARTAYKRALAAFEQVEKAKRSSEAALQQVYVLALLGQLDDARARLAKVQSRYPDDRDVRAFVDENHLDRMLKDSQFRQFAL